MKKIPSFTIVELIVAMLISSIAISIVYYSYFLLKGQFENRLKDSVGLNEYILFERAIKRDFDRADRIEGPMDNRQIRINTSENVILYTVDTLHILRSQGSQTDTFFLGGRIKGIQYFNDSLPLIAKMQVSLTVNRENMTLSVNKSYTAAALLDAEKRTHE